MLHSGRVNYFPVVIGNPNDWIDSLTDITEDSWQNYSLIGYHVDPAEPLSA